MNTDGMSRIDLINECVGKNIGTKTWRARATKKEMIDALNLQEKGADVVTNLPTPEQVDKNKTTFIWNAPIKTREIVFKSVGTIVSSLHGIMRDPNSPKIAITVKNGIYSTDDQDIIERLKKHPDFGRGNKKGFHIMGDSTIKLTKKLTEAGIVKPEFAEAMA